MKNSAGKPKRQLILICSFLFAVLLASGGEVGAQEKSKKVDLRIQSLIQKLKSDDADVRLNAARTLGRIGPKAAAAVPALIQALKDKASGVRRAAAWALGKIGPKAAAAVPALSQALRDSEKEVRLAAAYALLAITQQPQAEARNILLKGLDDNPWLTLNLLSDLGKKASFAAQKLKKLLQTESDPERKNLIQKILQKLQTQKSKKEKK